MRMREKERERREEMKRTTKENSSKGTRTNEQHELAEFY